MTQFALHQTLAKISSFNPRAEKHGDENKPAGDVKIDVAMHSTVLDHFSPHLRPLLFRAPALGEQPTLFKEGDDLTSLALPNLKPLALDEDFPGYRLEISAGLEFSDPLVLTDVKLSGFKFEGVNGGSVKLSLSAACHPDEDQAGALCQLIQETAYVSLIPPTAEAKADAQQQMPLGGAGDTLDQQDAEEEARRLTSMGAAQDEQKAA